jgi:hypothetical protein
MWHRSHHPAFHLLRHACLVLLLLAVAAPLARAQELIEPRAKDRKFPVGLFCPIALDLQFTANASSATIRFSTNVFYFNDGDQALRWTHQYLDNICVAPHDVYQNNLGPFGQYSQGCYIGEPVPLRFYFQNAGTIPLKELFATDPGPRGWDVAHGAYWEQNVTAPNDPGTETDQGSTGCLGLGQDSATPSASDSAYTSLVVTGLVPGQSYDLSGWWNVNDVFMELDKVFLTVHITGPGPTPIVQRTWGALKRQYR